MMGHWFPSEGELPRAPPVPCSFLNTPFPLPYVLNPQLLILTYKYHFKAKIQPPTHVM